MPKVIRADNFRYLTTDDWRTLTAVEMGMKNHELVPLELVHRISKVKRRGVSFEKILRDTLSPVGLVAYESAGKMNRGYRLTNLGYDYLALNKLVKSGQVAELSSMIGVGKESDVYMASAGEECGVGAIDEENEDADTKQANVESETKSPVIQEGNEPCTKSNRPEYQDPIVIKFHRLGRTSFRKVREKREYHQHRKNISWLYLDRLAAAREFGMMQELYTHGLPVPRPLAWNRSAIVMEYLTEGIQLSKLTAEDLGPPAHLFRSAINALIKIAELGLVHGDLNEFNLVVQFLPRLKSDDTPLAPPDDCALQNEVDLVLRVIDFPQMVSRDHTSADELYRRDRKGLVDYFKKFYEPAKEDLPPKCLANIERKDYLDVKLRAPGYPRKGKGRSPAISNRYQEFLESFSDIRLGDVAEESSDSDEGNDDSDEADQDANNDDVEENCVEDEGAAGQDKEESDDEKIESSATESDSEGDGSITTKEEKENQAKIRLVNRRGVYSESYVKERIRRERTKMKDKSFHSGIKRQQRMAHKREGKTCIKDNIDWF